MLLCSFVSAIDVHGAGIVSRRLGWIWRGLRGEEVFEMCMTTKTSLWLLRSTGALLSAMLIVLRDEMSSVLQASLILYQRATTILPILSENIL